MYHFYFLWYTVKNDPWYSQKSSLRYHGRRNEGFSAEYPELSRALISKPGGGQNKALSVWLTVSNSAFMDHLTLCCCYWQYLTLCMEVQYVYWTYCTWIVKCIALWMPEVCSCFQLRMCVLRLWTVAFNVLWMKKINHTASVRLATIWARTFRPALVSHDCRTVLLSGDCSFNLFSRPF